MQQQTSSFCTNTLIIERTVSWPSRPTQKFLCLFKQVSINTGDQILVALSSQASLVGIVFLEHTVIRFKHWRKKRNLSIEFFSPRIWCSDSELQVRLTKLNSMITHHIFGLTTLKEKTTKKKKLFNVYQMQNFLF